MRRVLVLRPEPGASETLARAAKLNLHAVSVPLFEVEPIAWELPDPNNFDGLLLTSANAPRLAGALLQLLRHLPAFAVGETTAAASRDAGLKVTAVGEAGVESLLGSIDPSLHLLHLAGEDRKIPVSGHKVTPLAVYRSKPVEDPALGDVRESVVLVHSPRAGQRLAELVQDRSAIAIVAISSAAAEAAGTGWQSVDIAERVSDDALLALAARLCNKPDA